MFIRTVVPTMAVTGCIGVIVGPVLTVKLAKACAQEIELVTNTE
jgi:hypothetical protein